MKLKKFAMIILALVMTLSLASCNEDAETLYNNAVDKMAALDCLEFNADIKASAGTDGLTYEIPVKLAGRTVRSGEDITMDLDLTLEMMGAKVEMGLYMADGYIYLQAPDTRVKLNAADIVRLPEEGAETPKIELPEGIFDEVEIKKENGLRSFEITVSGEELLSRAYAVVKEEIRAEVGETLDEASFAELDGIVDLIDLGDILCGITLNKEGYFESYRAKAEGSITNPDADPDDLEPSDVTAVSVEAEVRFIEPGKTFTIDPPADLADYVDATLNLPI